MDGFNQICGSIKVIATERGITLIEVLITMAIVILLAAFAVPLVREAAPNYRLRSFTYDVMASMQRAKAVAVMQNYNVRVRFDANGGGKGYTVVPDINNDGNYNEPPIIAKRYDDFGKARRGFSDGLTTCGDATLNWTGTGGGTVATVTDYTFSPRGTTVAGSIYFENGEGADDNNLCYAITTTNTGSVKVRKYVQCNNSEKKKCWIE